MNKKGGISLDNENLKFYIENINNQDVDDRSNVDRFMDFAIELAEIKDVNKINEEMQSILRSYEFISTKLNFEKDQERRKSYYYGMMYAIASFLVRQTRNLNISNELMHTLQKSKYLERVINVLDDQGMLSGPELCEYLEFHNRSSLTNFMKRIEPEHIFIKRRVGNVNYYLLSSKGEKYATLLKQRRAENIGDFDNNIVIRFAIALVDNIAKELRNPEQSVYRVINSTNLAIKSNVPYTSKALEQGINKIFNARRKYVMEYLKNAVNEEDNELEYFKNLNNDNNIFLEKFKVNSLSFFKSEPIEETYSTDIERKNIYFKKFLEGNCE